MKYDQNNITNDSGVTLGGICSVRFAPVEYFQFIREPSLITGSITTAVSFKPSKDWHDLEGIISSLDFEEKQAAADGGLYYNQQIRGTINKDDLERNITLHAMGYKDFLVLYTGRNGSVKLVGTLDSALSFTSALSTNKSAKDSEKFDFAFFGEAAERAPHYDV